MSTFGKVIVNPAWKGQKAGATVKFKGEDYEIGSDAFGSIQDAVTAGNTSELVIVDKKLSSPVNKEAITGADTDIFASTYKETESADGKTVTTNIKFTAAAGGSATIKATDADLKGFEKVTTTDAGGNFRAGKQDISSNVKTVSDMDKSLETLDSTASVSSSATGTLSVTGKTGTASVTVGAIGDISSYTDDSIEAIKAAYVGAKGEDDYTEKTGASYASVALKLAEINSINGGSYTEKGTAKTSNSNDEKKTEEYVYSYAEKVGAGSATLTNSEANNIIGFKSVKISSTDTVDSYSVGNIVAGTYSEDYSTKTAYDADKTSSINVSVKKAETVSGTLNISGNGTKGASSVEVGGEINGFSSITLKNATVTGEIESEVESKKSTIDISVKNQNDNPALTASFTADVSETADGSLSATNAVLAGLEGVKSVSLKGSVINGKVEANNTKIKATKKESGIADEISDSQADAYVSKFGVDYEALGVAGSIDKFDEDLIAEDQTYSFEYTLKKEKAAGGTSFKISGAAPAASAISSLEGYKTVSLDNSNSAFTVSAAIIRNDSSVTDKSVKKTYTQDTSYTKTKKTTETNKAFGDATIKGYTSASVAGFASVKATGKWDALLTTYSTTLGGVAGQNTYSYTDSENTSIKTGRDNLVGTFTGSDSTSSKLASTLDAQKVNMSGSYSNLKTAKLTNVAAGAIAFANARDYDSKASHSITWNAEEIDENPPTTSYNEKVTAWTYTKDEKYSVAGTFSLKISEDTAGVAGLSVDDYKQAEITISNTAAAYANIAGSLSNSGDKTSKTSEKRTVTETKRTQDFKSESKETAVGTLKITGKSAPADPIIPLPASTTTFTVTAGTVDYSSITLKDAVITGADAYAYTETKNYTASESATLDSGNVTAVTLKVSYTKNQSGNGSFSATASQAVNAFTGTLYGYNTISLKNNISIGGADNYKTTGTSGLFVPSNGGEYFDVIAVKEGDTVPADAVYLLGNVTGSYTLDKKGVSSSWKATNATVSAGSFNQTGKSDAFVSVGSISGYDKVTLEFADVTTAAGIMGTNTETVRTLTYKTVDDEEVANSDVTTVKTTSATSVKVSGRKADSTNPQLLAVVAGDITDYKTVTLTDVEVDGNISVTDHETVTAKDMLDGTVTTIDDTYKAVGSLTATNSTIEGNVYGFQKVTLANTVAGYMDPGADLVPGTTDDFWVASDFFGGSSGTTEVNTVRFYDEEAAAGSFTATADYLSGGLSVGDVTGFQKVALTEYSAGDVAVNKISNATKANDTTNIGHDIFATYANFTARDDEKENSEDTWKKAAATKNNSFTATAGGAYVPETTPGAGDQSIVTNGITVGDVVGYGKVEATGLDSIGDITNAFIWNDIPAFAGKVYSDVHYGNWSATAKTGEANYTAITVDPGTKAKVVGLTMTNTNKANPAYAPTAVEGDILGYTAIELDTVTLGDGTASSYKYAGGKYSYSTRTDRDDNVAATSTTTAVGSLKISNATMAAGTTGFEVEGFQTVNVNIADNAQFTSIIGGTQEVKFTGTALTSMTYKFSDDTSLKLTTANGSVGNVNGYADMKFTDTNATGTIKGYTISGNIGTAKSEITFDDTDATKNTVSGSILNAKKIVFKSSTADTTDDFAVTAVIKSQKAAATTTDPEFTASSLTIEVDKSQVSMDMSKFDLDSGDVINLISTTVAGENAVINIALGANDLATYFADMAGTTFTGTGTLAFTGSYYATAADFNTAWTAITDATTGILSVASATIGTSWNA